MLARIRRVPALAAAAALSLATAAGTAAATTPPAAGTPAATTQPAAGAAAATAPPAARAARAAGPAAATIPTSATRTLAGPQTTTLPNGDRVEVTGTGPSASVAVVAPDGRAVPFTRYAPDPHHAYVIPASVLADPAQLNAPQYLIPALSAPSTPSTPTTPSPPAAVKYYPLSILQINALGLDGAAATNASTFLQNTDDLTKFTMPIGEAGGVARVAVPTGHYSATTLFSTYDPATGIGTEHLVTQLDITVAAGGVTTVNPDERTATTQITAATPRPSVTDSSLLLFSRTDAKGQTSGLMMGGSGAVSVNPTAKAQVGAFSFQVLDWGGESPAGSSDLYRYDLMFPAADHVDTNQVYPVDTSKLTTAHNTVDTDGGNPRREGEYIVGAATPELGGEQIGHVIPVPAHVTTYTGAPVGDAIWLANFITALPSATSAFPAALFFGQDGPLYQGHAEVWRTWAHGPLTAQVGQYNDTTWCRSCADGGTVDLNLNTVVDSNPDTTVEMMGPATGHLTVYRDGNQVFSQDDYSGTELTGQAQQPGTYRMVFDLDLSQFPITQSTATHTDVTVPYTPAPNAKWTLPAGDTCFAQGTGTTACSILPVLNLNYQLASDDMNTTHGPFSTLLLTVGHQSYGTAGAQAAATGATVSVSYDKGATWTAASVIPAGQNHFGWTAASVIPAGQNHFVALWKNGAKGTTPWLKVTATDNLGGSITQTIANAYTIG